MQIPILQGIYADVTADFRTSYPINMRPAPKATGINQGYLRMTDGIEALGQGSGVCRGVAKWRGVIYRVMGNDLVREEASGSLSRLAGIPGSGTVSMAHSFTHLGIVAAGRFFLYDGTSLSENIDSDLGVVIDVEWVDGYFMLTDGENLIVTELTNPLDINPLKYGSSEVDPDPVLGVVKLRNEIHAVNRHTIETFQNTGGDLFPFQRVTGAQIHRGAIGTHMCTVFMDAIAFVGGGDGESPAVWMGANGQSQKISSAEIDLLLQEYTEDQLSASLMETQVDRGHQNLLIHLPDKTVCYDAAASAVLGELVWYFLSSSTGLDAAYDGRHLVWAYDRWSIGQASGDAIGRLTRDTFTHWGNEVSWEFATPIVYNEGNGLQFHEIELVCLTGATAFGLNPVVLTSYSQDGVLQSQEYPSRAGASGGRRNRLRWTRQGAMENWRTQKFRGSSDAPISPVRIEATVEPLAW